MRRPAIPAQRRANLKSLALLICGAVSLLLGCTPIKQIRTIPTPAEPNHPITYLPAPVLSDVCDTGRPTEGENRNTFEDYGSYVLAFAEFDDQGWSYSSDAQIRAIQTRLESELNDSQYNEFDYSVMVFVHGWHHNAHDNDCNVQEARQMVKLASESFDGAYKSHVWKRQRRVFGIYVGWRGESIDAAGLRYVTAIDRRDTAEKVAKGSVRQLFANLHELQLAAKAAAGTVLGRSSHVDDGSGSSDASRRMYTTVVGHSFGGLIVFNSLSQQMTNDLTAALQSNALMGCSEYKAVGAAVPDPARNWPDEVILINPAFEASRFETLNRLADRSAACGYQGGIPLLTVVTADDDFWTGPAFAAARRLLTLFEGYDRSSRLAHAEEEESNLHAIGFVSRYRTHRLCVREGPGGNYATVSLTPALGRGSKDLAARPVWVVGAPPDIVYGHNGFLYARSRHGRPLPYLLDWLIDRHLNPNRAIAEPGSCGRWP